MTARRSLVSRWSVPATLIVGGVVMAGILIESCLSYLGYNDFTYYAGLPNHRLRHLTFEFDQHYDQNEFGFRGPNRALDKPDGVFRILVLGDSYTYGLGVANDETYCRVLENLLNESPVTAQP